MRRRSAQIAAAVALLASACASPAGTPNPPAATDAPPVGTTSPVARQRLVVYSGRSETLVGPVLEQFQQASGMEVAVRWGSTPELAATLLEEGPRTPANVFYAQDPGGLGAVIDMLSPLPQDILDEVDSRFRDPESRWVGISGRARVVVYNTDRLTPADLPQGIEGFTDPVWAGRIGWAPGNASFQTMVTAMRVVWGEERTRAWLEGILANAPHPYESNSAIVAAVGSGEIDVGFVNHYYLHRFLQEEGESFPARNHFYTNAGPESLIMVSGAGVLAASDNQQAAFQFLRFLLSPVAQQYFASQTFEYPVVEGVVTSRELPPLEQLSGTTVELSDLADLRGTVSLLQEVGALP
jgi:iron(III) transport system substrate-binding protein